MNFSLDTFLKPLTPNDLVIRIYNSSGVLYNSTNPFSIIRTYASNNVLNINLNRNQIIKLNFSTSDDAGKALSKLQSQIDILKTKTPAIVDTKIQNQVNALREVVDRVVFSGPSNVVTLISGLTSDKILTVAINGIAIHDWTIVGTSLTINNIPYDLDSDDSIIIEYNRPV
jgi:hypothetical protein